MKLNLMFLIILCQFNNLFAKTLIENEDYSISPDQVYEVEQNYQQLVTQNNINNNSSTRAIASVTEDATSSTEFENIEQCSSARKFYEMQITKSKKLKELLIVNDSHESKLSKMCISRIMNKFSVPNSRFANCPKAAGAAQTPGAKPCVTENLVNLTYNSYMDVTECLNLDPKMLLPKIGYESGFFINTLGYGYDGGLGQLTRPAIAEVNNFIDQYVEEMAKASDEKPACARLLKYKSFFKKAPIQAEERCSVIGLPENPLKNILYMALLNRINMDQISGIKYVAGFDYVQNGRNLASMNNNSKDELGGTFKSYAIKEKLIKLGIKKPDMHFFKEIILLIGYNTGVHTAANLLKNYLDLRIENNLKLTMKDFDFNNTRMVKDDVSGEEVDQITLARSFVMSPFSYSKDNDKIVNDKKKRLKMLPKLWATSYKKTFPEFLTYRANGYDGKSKNKKFSIYGFPGYLNLVAERNKALRIDLKKSNLDPDLCSDPNFLKVKN